MPRIVVAAYRGDVTWLLISEVDANGNGKRTFKKYTILSPDPKVIGALDVPNHVYYDLYDKLNWRRGECDKASPRKKSIGEKISDAF